MRQLKITKSITNRDSITLDKYLQEIGKVDLITSEEEVILAVKIREGDQQALERLTKANLRFVVSVAKQYQNQGLTLPDLINEGNLGLIKAAKRFDETRGFKFISYAVWWIRQSIISAIAENSRMVRLPLNKVGNLTKIKKGMSELEQKLEREPTVQELAELIELNADEIENAMNIAGRHQSIDAPFVEGEDHGLLDVMENNDSPKADKALMIDSLRKEIERSLATLTEREADVLRMFFGIGFAHPFSLEEIGDKHSLTRERVRQIKEKAVKRLQHNTRSRLLKTYLG
ncbi:MAG: RNA polymerase primary sigma factor [Saprospiraceae bacterium]|jgi:RNA polymerase primary sigma factor